MKQNNTRVHENSKSSVTIEDWLLLSEELLRTRCTVNIRQFPLKDVINEWFYSQQTMNLIKLS